MTRVRFQTLKDNKNDNKLTLCLETNVDISTVNKFIQQCDSFDDKTARRMKRYTYCTK